MLNYEDLEGLIDENPLGKAEGKTIYKTSKLISYIETKLLPNPEKGGKVKELEMVLKEMYNIRAVRDFLNDCFSIYGKKYTYKNAKILDKDELEISNLSQLTSEKTYKTILLYMITFMYAGTKLDMGSFFYQLIEVEKTPLNTFFDLYAYILKGEIVKVNRGQEEENLEKFLPIQILFKENQWFLIGYNYLTEKYVKVSIHNIKRIASSDPPEKAKNFNPNWGEIDKYKDTFSVVVNDITQKTNKIVIKVSNNRRKAIEDRYGIGKWEPIDKDDQFFQWEIELYEEEEDEFIDYLFKWNYGIKVLEPLHIRDKLKEKCRGIVDSINKDESNEMRLEDIKNKIEELKREEKEIQLELKNNVEAPSKPNPKRLLKSSSYR